MSVTDSVTICCAAGYGEGGLGLHLRELVEAARSEGRLGGYIAHSARDGDEPIAQVIDRTCRDWLFAYTPLRFNHGGKAYLNSDWFDRAAARRLNGPTDTLICFAGQALHTFNKARARGYRRLALVSATSHVDHVARNHARAVERWRIEPSWLNNAQHRKVLAEYEMADVIHVASDYVLDSFLEAGVAREKLLKIRLTTHPRFMPPLYRETDRVFRMIYVGSLTVVKGIPLLLEAFEQLNDPLSELVLVGGTATRAMRRYIKRRMARDRRIIMAPGDPLPHLHRANLYIHPSYDDGFGYAPMEAVACGVPVIVSENTGMKECLREGVDGSIVPTGDVTALVARIKAWRERTMAAGQ